MDKDKLLAVISDLVERCKDGREGFRTASQDVKDPELKTLFQEYALQRDRMITELQHELHKFGKSLDESPSLEGGLHRAWIDIKSALTSGNRKRILEEAERGEDYAVAAYKKALKEPLPQPLGSVVEDQFQRVKAAHDNIRNLRDTA